MFESLRDPIMAAMAITMIIVTLITSAWLGYVSGEINAADSCRKFGAFDSPAGAIYTCSLKSKPQGE